MPYVVGIVLSIGVAVLARSVGFDRDRAFYPTVMIVIASYYVLFAAMSGSPRPFHLLRESVERNSSRMLIVVPSLCVMIGLYCVVSGRCLVDSVARRHCFRTISTP
jgi:hydrogenase-4 membrane subunit HyfE